ncbi:hypothetical protein MTP04_04400 [Lysinibacillus sp. PLM2]|nr:hypothetical protein MTP04_04400 [Lysinibacillus sp. PLM2]
MFHIYKNIQTTFRLYQSETSKFNSSFFDLINGENETKQTKGLAYLLNISPELLKEFLSMKKIKESIKKSLTNNEYKLFLKSDFAKIDAEMISVGIEKVRRDITLTFYYKSLKVFVLIIEAKNIKLGKNHKMEIQLQKYIDPNYFQGDIHIPKLVVSLTRYEQFFENPRFISITWEELIQILNKTIKSGSDETKALILKDYLNFITGVDKEMNFYEKEVLSVPAGKTFNEIAKYNIHACPVSYNYRDSLFITFRQKGGVMERLYKVEKVIVIDPRSDSMIEVVAESEPLYKERILSYIRERKSKYGFNHDEEYRFYVLSEKEIISLPHTPHPERNNSGPRYYSLSEILSGKEIV